MRRSIYVLLYGLQPLLFAHEPTPDLAIESLRAKGNALIDAGRYEEALPLAEQLLAARRDKLGAEHLDVARSLNSVAFIHDRLRHGTEAQRHYLEAIAMRERLLGPEHLLVAQSAQMLGDHYSQFRRVDAEKWLGRALEIRERLLGDSSEVAETLESLARWHYQKEDHSGALPLAERAARVSLTVLAWPDGGTAKRFDLLGVIGKRLGKLEVANTAREHAFWSFEALYGWSDLRTQRSGRLLASHLMEAGELPRARTLFDKVVKSELAESGAEERAFAFNGLGECLTKQKEAEKAIEAYQQSVLLEDKIPGGGDSRVIMAAKCEIANTHFILKRFKEAEPLYLDRLQRFVKAGNAQQVRFMHEWLGSFYAKAGDKKKAERYLTESVSLVEKLPNQPNSEVADANRALGKFLKEEKQFARATTHLERAFQVHESIVGEERSNLSWLEEAADVSKKADDSRAIELYTRLLMAREKRFGPQSLETSHALIHLGRLHRHRDDLSRAEPLLLRAYAICEKAGAGDDALAIVGMSELAECYRKKLDHANAAVWQQRVLDRRRQKLGPEHADTIRAIADLARIHQDRRDFPRALELRQEALALSEKVFGAGARETISRITGLAGTHTAAREFAAAEPLYQKALELSEQLDGPESAEVADRCRSLARCYRQMTEFSKAEALYERALRIRAKVFGSDSEKAIEARESLAWLWDRTGDFARMADVCRELIAARKRTSGESHQLTGDAMSDLGYALHMQGEYSTAVSVLEDALRILEARVGREHEMTARAFGRLGIAHLARGDLARAEPLLRENADFHRKVHGPEHPDTGRALSLLGMVYFNIGEFRRAEEALRAAWDIARRAGDEKNESTLMVMTMLATVTASQGKKDDVKLAEQALVFAEETHGRDSLASAVILKQLALIHEMTKRVPEARSEMKRCVRILEEKLGKENAELASTHVIYGYLCLADGAFSEAAEHCALGVAIAEKTLGPSNPLRYFGGKLLATAELALGNQNAAKTASRRAQETIERFVENLLSFTSEQQRLAWPQYGPHDVAATVGDAEGLARSVLRLKGVILDSLLEDRVVAAEANRAGQGERLRELRALKQQLFEAGVTSPITLAGNTPQVRPSDLRDKIERLEASMAQTLAAAGHSRQALGVTTEMVQAALPPHAVLIEFLRYDHVTSGMATERRYGAIVIPARGEPHWVALGHAGDLEKEIHLYLKSARGNTDEPTLAQSLRLLHTRIWVPIADFFEPGIETVIVSPDGELNFISFATFLGPDEKFLTEKYSIRYAGSGRDFLRKPKTAKEDSIFIFGNPLFIAETGPAPLPSSNGVTLHATEMHGLQSLALAPLPGSEAEAKAIMRWVDASKGKGKLFLGPAATETQIQQLDSPRVLHLATHGFLLPEAEATKIDLSQLGGAKATANLINPMHRSGVALTGARRTFDAWSRGEAPPSGNDGVVTAEEVGGLNLDGTWLVVLSACDTGLGEARAGEGVMGLRRGFIQAGTQNLLMTLWPISDETTVQIMLDFYDAAFKTGNAPQALADIQRDWLVKLRKERGLLAAVQLAGPFIMSSQGRP